MGRKRPSSSPLSTMNTAGPDSSSHPVDLDSWAALRTDLSPHDKATVAIDAITNELPERSALPFEFFELAVLALQKSTDDARAAVQQRNKIIDELRTLCSNLEARLAALSAAPALPLSSSAAASTSASVAVHSAGRLSKPPNISSPQDPTQAATSAKSCIPMPPVASSALPSDASIGATRVLVPTPPAALSARPSGASTGSLPPPSDASSGAAPPHCVLTPPVALSARLSGASTGLVSIPLNTPTFPFRGRCGTKPNELHVQFKSRAEFNTKLMRFFDNNIISHRHSLLNALVSAVCTRIDEKSSLLFSGNRLRAAFWTPRGNLLIRFLKAPSPSLLAFMLDTLEVVCDAKDFIVLNRPPVSTFKLSNVSTHARDGSPINLDQLTLELLAHPQLRNAALWHMPRFVSFKGAPLGRHATLFFSVADSPNYDLGRTIIGSQVSISDRQFTIEKWHHTKLAPNTNVPVGGHRIFKETAGLLSPSKSHHNMSRERFLTLENFRNNFVSPPPLSRREMEDLGPIRM